MEANLVREWVGARPLAADGAWGTELQKAGLAAGVCGDVWNLEQPEKVRAVARAYVEAGSEIILTNTFESSLIGLAKFGLAGRAGEINRAGVRISREAAAGRARVFGSMGPCGKMIVAGEVTAEEVSAAFTAQAEALAEAGADALLIETMSELEEARLALQAARSTGLPVVVSFAFASGKNRDRTMMGVTPEQAAEAMAGEGAAAVGANCGHGIDAFIPLCRRLRAASGLPVWIKPNAGMPVLEGGEVRYPASAEEFASAVPALIEAGASFVGGCCGTTPAFVRAIRERLNACV